MRHYIWLPMARGLGRTTCVVGLELFPSPGGRWPSGSKERLFHQSSASQTLDKISICSWSFGCDPNAEVLASAFERTVLVGDSIQDTTDDVVQTIPDDVPVRVFVTQ